MLAPTVAFAVKTKTAPGVNQQRYTILLAQKRIPLAKQALEYLCWQMRSILFCCLLWGGTPAFAQDSLVCTQLLQKVEALQVKQDGVFPAGSIPSWRMYVPNPQRYKADVNPFFTGLVAFTLLDLKKDLGAEQQALAQNIIARAQPFLRLYRNHKNNRDTYNFWSAQRPLIFPNGGWLNWFNKSQALPDDMDDTVILLMAQAAPDSTARQVHQWMQQFTNGAQKQVQNSLPAYQQLGAYSTWMGKKMPIDFDVSVLCNLLYFVQQYQLPWTAADSASLELISATVRNGDHLKATALVSPHYYRLPNVLYHLSRLMSLKPLPALDALKPQLIAQTQQALKDYPQFMDQVILGTALLRWGVAPPPTLLQGGEDLTAAVEDPAFCFFIANMASMLPLDWKKTLTQWQWGSFYYHAPAFNHVLLLENLVWRKRRGLGTW